jgi:hypothetical protein
MFLKRKEKPLEKMDDNEIAIKWGDELISQANEYGEIKKSSFILDTILDSNHITEEEKEWCEKDPARKIRNYLISKIKNVDNDGEVTTVRLDPINRELEKFETKVKNHLLSHEYIKPPIAGENIWRIDENGKQLKRFGGHQKYKLYKERELAATVNEHKSKRYYMPVVIALGGVLISGAISLATYLLNRSNSINAEERLSKQDTLQQQEIVKLQNLQSQVDSISNLLLSKSVDTTEKKQQVIKSTNHP